MQIRDEKLRSDRLVFYAQDVERLDSELDAFLELCGARCALLIDKEGHLVTRRGEAVGSSIESISALIAGSFAATKEMARQLGEDEFTILFDQRTNLGLVRFYAQETGRQLAAIFAEMAERPAEEGSGLSKNFSQDASDALDKLF